MNEIEPRLERGLFTDSAIARLRAHAVESGVQFEEHAQTAEGKSGRYPFLTIPVGDRETTRVPVPFEWMIERLAATPLKNKYFLKGLAAVACKSSGTVEGELRAVRTSLSRAIRALWPKNTGDAEQSKNAKPALSPLVVFGKYRERDVEIRIGEMMDELLYVSCRRSPIFENQETHAPPLSIRITGLRTDDHDSTLLDFLRLSDALLFQMDEATGIVFRIEGRHDLPSKPVVVPLEVSKHTIVFPRVAYDPKPLAMYKYARAAKGMPLLQYLAFYQVVEHYFPIYLESEINSELCE